MALPPSLDDNKRFPSWVSTAFKIVVAIVASSFISSIKLDYIESYLYDLRVTIKAQLGLSKLKDSPVALVLITNKTVERYRGFPTFKDHTEFASLLFKAEPKYVLYDFSRLRSKDLFEITGDFEQQKLFADVAGRFENFYIPSQELEMQGEKNKIRLNPPLDSLVVFPGPKAQDLKLLAKDGVYRRFLFSYQGQKVLHPIIASFYNPKIGNVENIRGLFPFFDTLQGYVNYYPTGSFPSYSFEDIVDGRISSRELKGKVIIVGTHTGKSNDEYVLTPYSREPNAMTSAEFHANIIQTLIENSSPVKPPFWFNQFLTILISILTIYVVMSLRPSQGLLILLLTLGITSIIALILYIAFGIWVELAHPFLTIFLFYYFFIPYRLIKENRRSWEYYQKNKLLSQVEELKTNFISMMSHDLKTPLARIQGMTEVILQGQQPMSATQREAVDTIKSSSDDLLRFINAILQYGRIESQGLEINRQSKDVNSLVTDVVRKHEFLARVKKIRVVTELEPLFPITLDAELMNQVFSNLLENSIKYSAEESQVTVTTKEKDGHLIIEFKDQGLGIPTVDLPNIFMKFFRGHGVKTSNIKGSGLGLYLAKYFTELHRGRIEVGSTPGVGSVFVVYLPLEN
jgi:signal transduction histidine kinase